MSMTSWDMMFEIAKGGDEAKQLNPLMYEIVIARDTSEGTKCMIDKLESDIANSNIAHISVECINALINGCCNDAQEAKFYEKVREAKDNIKRLNWLKKRFLWAKLGNEVTAVANEIKTYLPDDKKILAWKIDDLYLEFMVESKLNFDGNYIQEGAVEI